MQFQLSGQQIEVTPALREHATAKLDRLTRLDDKLMSLAIVLSVDKLVAQLRKHREKIADKHQREAREERQYG